MGGVRVIPIRTLHQLHQVGRRVLLIELVNTFQNALRSPVSVSLLLLKSPLLLCVALLLLYALSDPLSLLRKLFGIPRQEVHQLRALGAGVVFFSGLERHRIHQLHAPPTYRLDNRPGAQADGIAPP
jgi:hypothetical protein